MFVLVVDTVLFSSIVLCVYAHIVQFYLGIMSSKSAQLSIWVSGLDSPVDPIDVAIFFSRVGDVNDVCLLEFNVSLSQ